MPKKERKEMSREELKKYLISKEGIKEAAKKQFEEDLEIYTKTLGQSKDECFNQLITDYHCSLKLWLDIYHAPKMQFSKTNPNTKVMAESNILKFQLLLDKLGIPKAEILSIESFHKDK